MKLPSFVKSGCEDSFSKNDKQFAETYSAASNEDRWKKYIIPTLKESIAEYKTSAPGIEHKHLAELNQIEGLLKNPKFDRDKIIDLLIKIIGE